MAKKIPFFILLILLMSRVYAQQDYFVLIQADDNQPFFVRLEGKTFSSSAKGHLILSQLKEGAYAITIGFPQNRYSDQPFSIVINKKDLEFRLKNLGDKGWNLFNPQTLELITVDKGQEAPATHNEGIRKDDAFSRMMAGVVSDTAVMYNTYAMEQALKDSPAVKSDTVAFASNLPSAQKDTLSEVNKAAVRTGDTLITLVAKTDSVTSSKGDSITRQGFSGGASGVPENHPAVADRTSDTTKLQRADSSITLLEPPHNKGVVAKLSERKTTRGLRLVYADKEKGVKTDTVVIIIPPDSNVTVSRPRIRVDTPAANSVSGTPLFRPASAPNSAGLQPVKPKETSSAGTVASSPAGKLVVVNSDCKNFATDYDVDKLRVKMLELGKDEDRILAAKRVFKSKCFTTNQIRALSEVFTTDAVKYKFFEAAYPFVSDDHFRELSGQLVDPVYNGKFRAMTGQQ